MLDDTQIDLGERIAALEQMLAPGWSHR